MIKSLAADCCFLLFLLSVTTLFSAHLYQKASAEYLSAADLEGDAFRALQLSQELTGQLRPLSEETSLPVGELLTVLLPFQRFRYLGSGGFLTDDLIRWKELLLRYNRSGFERVSGLYAAIWDDVQCMPVAAKGIRYENSWMFERTYGGLRGHEGTDLMPPENLPGYYPVVSMTDGVVEQIGWLPKGGWRIGIRSPSGGYFYYAHLDSYARDFAVGETVTAGELLGRMGDTGYGEQGTRGKFAVHLHLGIYVRTEHTEELSVNPYWVLRYVDQ